MTPAKDLYFFDRFYQKGLQWYAQQFDEGAGYPVVGEISHDYLYSQVAAQRLRQDLPDARLMVCLREPCERTFSAYLHLVKSGHFRGTFEEALETFPGLVNRSQYGKHLAMYLDYFPREQVVCSVFDDLSTDPQLFADKLFGEIGLPSIPLSESLRGKALPAGQSRSVLLTQLLKRIADVVRSAGMPKLVGQVKTSPVVQRVLFRSYSDADKPRLTPQMRDRLRSIFAPDIEQLDRLMGTNLSRRWSYTQHPPQRAQMVRLTGFPNVFAGQPVSQLQQVPA